MNEPAVAEGFPDKVREILFGTFPDYVEIYTRSGNVYRVGHYINGQNVNCIDTIKETVSHGPMVYLEQFRKYPDCKESFKAISLLTSTIAYISYHGNKTKIQQQFF